MTITPEQLRAELLHLIWRQGPVTADTLLDLGRQYERGLVEIAHQLIILRAHALIDFDESPVAPLYGPALDAEDAARREYGRLSGVRACRVCGCSDDWGCEEGCWWAEAEENLCTSCADPVGAPA